MKEAAKFSVIALIPLSHFVAPALKFPVFLDFKFLIFHVLSRKGYGEEPVSIYLISPCTESGAALSYCYSVARYVIRHQRGGHSYYTFKVLMSAALC